ncbi:protein of unknown function [Thauera humireducens]|nr:protein of unknown function [Thauera humireducens]
MEQLEWKCRSYCNVRESLASARIWLNQQPASTGLAWLTWRQATAALKEIVLEDMEQQTPHQAP